MEDKEIYVLTFIYGGIIEKHILTRSEDRVRQEIMDFALDNNFKISGQAQKKGVYAMVDYIKSNNGMCSHEIHLDAGEVED